ncbi:MAG: hypothetical protein L3J56_09970 [Bacteroidales bacterium]|nr:hypothetical protein [Bacteroidales bacterium]
MKNNFMKISTLLLLGFLFTFSACKKDNADTQSAEDAARGSYIMADAFAISNSGSDGGKALSKRFADCNFTYAKLNNGFELTFANCTDDAGITRNGTIRVTAEANAFDTEGAGSITITFINYTVDNEGISGTITATFKSGALGFYFNITAKDLRLDYADNTHVLYNTASLTYVFSLANKFSLEITGNSDGINRNGDHFTTETEKMKVEFFASTGCPFPTEGTMTINVDGENPITLNFDSGTCGEITVSQKGHKDGTITIF